MGVANTVRTRVVVPLQTLANLLAALRERQAWQRLIGVIGHELGNSLGPITSIAGSLENRKDPRGCRARLTLPS